MAWSPTRVSPAPCSAWLTGRPAGASPQTLQADGLLSDGPLSGGPLPGGTANRGLVIRVGDTVLRPTAPCWRATHALLAHLSAVGFDGAPHVLAVSAATEMLTYIDGHAAVPPLPVDTLTDAALVSVAELLRRYHLAAASFEVEDEFSGRVGITGGLEPMYILCCLWQALRRLSGVTLSYVRVGETRTLKCTADDVLRFFACATFRVSRRA